jgi:diguanylate cyclase (GGDEF)-like protein/PAS domain S-box-containing protein
MLRTWKRYSLLIRFIFCFIILNLVFSLNAFGGDSIKKPDLYINEFMASNGDTIVDEAGDSGDWIELYNPTDKPVDIGGFYISDHKNEPLRWQIPDDQPEETTIPPGGYLLLWADEDTEKGPLHLGFKLSKDGESITLTAPDKKTVIDQIEFGKQERGVSYGRKADGSDKWEFFLNPTPAAPNQIVGFSSLKKAGFYTFYLENKLLVTYIIILLFIILLLSIIAISFTVKLKRSESELKKINEEQSLLLDNIQTQVWYLEDIDKYGTANKAFLEFTGIDKDELENKSLLDIRGEEETAACIKGNKEVFQKKEQIKTEEWVENWQGEKRLLSITKTPKLDNNGQVEYVICSAEDITEKRRIEDQIRKLAREYETIFSNTQDAIFLVDVTEDGKFRYNRVNFSYLELTGFSAGDLKDKTPQEVYGKEFGKEIEANYKKCLTEKRAISYDEELDLPAGKRIYHTSLSPVIVDDKVVQIVGSSRNITERKQMEEKIKHLSFHDSLTGLYNRTYFNEEMKRYDTERQLPLSIIIGDVNGLKLTNDAFGHQKGDELLIKVAQILKSSCRQEDLIARWGGDEFIILLPRTTEKGAQEICLRIKEACQKSKADPIKPSIALGYGTRKEKTEDLQVILKKAEDRMYKNKLNESKNTHNTIISSLKKTLGETTGETSEHSQRLKGLALKLGRKLNLEGYELKDLALLAELHDLGKVAISKDILQKKGQLGSEELEEIKRHPEIGYKIASSSPELNNIAEGILSHHERWDGTGYPRGLKEKEIPLISRIIAIIDAYDIMTYGSPYKEAISKEEAIKELEKGAGSQFDPLITDIFINQVLNK